MLKRCIHEATSEYFSDCFWTQDSDFLQYIFVVVVVVQLLVFLDTSSLYSESKLRRKFCFPTSGIVIEPNKGPFCMSPPAATLVLAPHGFVLSPDFYTHFIAFSSHFVFLLLFLWPFSISFETTPPSIFLEADWVTFFLMYHVSITSTHLQPNFPWLGCCSHQTTPFPHPKDKEFIFFSFSPQWSFMLKEDSNIKVLVQCPLCYASFLHAWAFH